MGTRGSSVGYGLSIVVVVEVEIFPQAVVGSRIHYHRSV